MKIVTAAEMREIDRVTSERFGIPSLTLMENAGAAVADFVLLQFPAAKNIGVICGKGNNGGDGFVAARKLYQSGREVRLLLLADRSDLRGDAAEMFTKLLFPPVTAQSGDELNEEKAVKVLQSDLLVDAILGTGFKPPVSGLYAEAISKINGCGVPVVAVDIPSGADADATGKQTGVIARADAVVTFTAPRPAHVFGRLTSGSIVVSPIGSPDEAIVSSLNLHVITAKDVAGLIRPRKADSNKDMYGHVLVVGGSRGKAGAAAMAGMAALRSGAGLSTVATASSVLATVAGFHPELMTEELEETAAGSVSLRAFDQAEALAKNKTVIAIGPGISRAPETSEFVRKLLQAIQTKQGDDASLRGKSAIVLDADGLNAFEGRTNELMGRRDNQKSGVLVITPHPGEMARLAGCTIEEVQRDRQGTARKFAKEHQVIVVLKGDRTRVAKPNGELWVNTTGNPGMATGGTGDILTGMIAGLLAQNPSHAFEAVTAAVYLHGLAGDVACEHVGEHSLVATDLVTFLPEAFRRVRQSAPEKLAKIQS
ncbi:MAG: NAD(P)H-hydrate dehydratase [Acidobacteriota bacterium]|nr:NAD(P)H-hydrate dehydratase [Acidobacteriota bacterium]